MSGVQLTDVPDRYDVVFQLNDGTLYGFLLSDALESNLPFRTHKALYSYSPTFLERENVSNQYGDNFQDFFLTGSQDDFSLGEMQKYFRVNDADRSRRYWAGKNIDPTTTPGNIVLTPALSAGTPFSGFVTPNPDIISIADDWFLCDGTNLYRLTSAGVETTIGAHGATTITGGFTTDISNVYIASTTTGIRKWNGSVFSTFNTMNNVSILVFLNNILYGYEYGADSLVSFDAAGGSTTQFQWKNADVTFVGYSRVPAMVPYGGELYILRDGNTGTELWKYDGTGCSMLANFPRDFQGKSMCVSDGIVYIGGGAALNTSSSYIPQVYYYANGSVGKLWESNGIGNAVSGMDAVNNGIVFQDPSTTNIYQYDVALGGVHCIAQLSIRGIANTAPINISSSLKTYSILAWGGTSGLHAYIYKVTGGGSGYNSTGFIQTSLYDFDNTLTKVFRGIKVDADIPANTSMDLWYQLDSTTGSYTLLATGITSGTEYFLPANTNAHAISVQVVLNSATGTSTPTLKRVYVRAAPTLQQFRRREYIFDLSGGYRSSKGKVARVCRDGTPYPYDGNTAANNLIKVATQTVPFTVVDRFSTSSGFTCLTDLQQNQAGFDGFAIYEMHPGVYLARINVREV